MNLKKVFLISLILLCLSLSAVSAADLNDTQICQASSVSDDVQCFSQEFNQKDTHFLDELQSKINQAEAGSVIDLDVDYDDVNGNGIQINKDLTIDGHGHTIDRLGINGPSVITSEKGNIVLKNLNIINGHNDKTYEGGAIFITGSAAYTLENCIFSSNWADDYGGAIYNDVEKTLTIKNCYFKSNTVDDDDGGAIFSKGGISIENSAFDYNNAHDKGGAIYCLSHVIIADSSFTYNNAKGAISVNCNGGAVFSKGTVTVKGSSFKKNYAEDYGGAIYAEGDVNINHADTIGDFTSFFTENSVSDDKGGAVYAEGNVKIVNAELKSNSAYVDGGAILSKGNAEVKHCIFDGNSAKGANSQCYGGAIRACDVTVTNSTFNKNFATDYGGAIYCENLNVMDTELTKSYFTNNEANDDNGGAVYADEKVIAKNAIFSSNKAKVDGGAIYASNVNVKDCSFEKNKAEGAKSHRCFGGAIRAGEAVVDNSNFNGNTAENHGGAIYADKITLSNKNCFTGNTATKGQGGAIFTEKFLKDVTYATFINNRAGVTSSDDGGAIYIDCSNEVTFAYCIFVNNQCSDEGGAIYLDSCGSKLTLKNNFFYGNNAGDGKSVYNCGDYEEIEKNWWGGKNPSSNNDQLIEWVSIGSNKHHSDSNFLIPILMVNSVHSSGQSIIAVQLSFYTSTGESVDGNIFNLDEISISASPDAQITKKMMTQDGIYVELKPAHNGSYTITIDFYGYKLSRSIYLTGN